MQMKEKYRHQRERFENSCWNASEYDLHMTCMNKKRYKMERNRWNNEMYIECVCVIMLEMWEWQCLKFLHHTLDWRRYKSAPLLEWHPRAPSSWTPNSIPYHSILYKRDPLFCLSLHSEMPRTESLLHITKEHLSTNVNPPGLFSYTIVFSMVNEKIFFCSHFEKNWRIQ